MGMEETLSPGPNFNRPVKDLVYKDLLTSTFTKTSHDRGIRTCRSSVSYPQCVFSGNKFRWEPFNVECHKDPNIGKATIGKERTVAEIHTGLATRP
jgi:hypothetical protein